jgi:hypothetical protein
MSDFVTSFAVQTAVVLMSSAILLLIWGLLRNRIDFPLSRPRLFGMLVIVAILALLALPDVLERPLAAGDLIATALIIAGLRALVNPLDRSLNGPPAQPGERGPIPQQGAFPRQSAPDRGGSAPGSPSRPAPSPDREPHAIGTDARAGSAPAAKSDSSVAWQAPAAGPSPIAATPPPQPPDEEENRLYGRLLAMVLHDEQVAESLIAHERQFAPNATRKELIKRAIERLYHDRRVFEQVQP